MGGHLQGDFTLGGWADLAHGTVNAPFSHCREAPECRVHRTQGPTVCFAVNQIHKTCSPAAADVMGELVTGLTMRGWLQSSSKRFRVAVEGTTSACSLTMPQSRVHMLTHHALESQTHTQISSLSLPPLCHIAQCLYDTCFSLLQKGEGTPPSHLKTCRKGFRIIGPDFGIFCQNLLIVNITDTSPRADASTSLTHHLELMHQRHLFTHQTS